MTIQNISKQQEETHRQPRILKFLEHLDEKMFELMGEDVEIVVRNIYDYKGTIFAELHIDITGKDSVLTLDTTPWFQGEAKRIVEDSWNECSEYNFQVAFSVNGIKDMNNHVDIIYTFTVSDVAGCYDRESCYFAEKMYLISEKKEESEEEYLSEMNSLIDYYRLEAYRKKTDNIKPSRVISHQQRYEVCKRQKWKCNQCGIRLKYNSDSSWEGMVAHIDHIHPYSKFSTYPGGSSKINETSNLQALCPNCNRMKGSKNVH